MDDSEEIWKPVVCYEGHYAISNYGRVYSFKTHRIRKCWVNGDGYRKINLSKNGIERHHSISRLVAAAFIGPCPEGQTVNHKDGNKQNDHDWNLEYLTVLENVRHAISTGLRFRGHPPAIGNKLTPADVIEIKRLKGALLQREIAVRYGICRQVVSHIHNGRIWQTVIAD